MGLLDKLTTQGSVLTAYDGKTPKVNPLATKQSKLHADGSQAGYSLDGSAASIVSADYTAYNDGYNNALPQPSLTTRPEQTSACVGKVLIHAEICSGVFKPFFAARASNSSTVKLPTSGT